jgi:hypothetical protein
LDTALTGIAPDGSALTTTFDDLVVEVGQGVTESDVTQSFSMTLPLSDGAKGKTLRVQAQGYAIALGGTSARLTLRLNGQVRVRNFPAGSNTEFVQTLEVPAIPVSTAQLSGVIEVQEDPGTGAVANLSVVSIDSEVS